MNPDSAYVDHGDGTVTDTRSGLMWRVCSEGQTWGPGACSGPATTYAWAAALAHAEAATDSRYSDWRLPNIKELRGLVEECRIAPAINETVFPNTPSSHFWSGSPDAYYSDHAWLVSFYYGYADYDFARGYARYVRLVRGRE
jgi:hypothetical protein